MSINVTLRQLEVFLAVARSLSFSEASLAIHLSQPALSAAVHKLEETLGARLFDRNTRNVALTPVGHELLGVAENLLHGLDAGMAGVRDYLGGKRGRLAVACSPSLAAGFLPEVVAQFQRSHPAIDLALHDTLSEVSIDLVRSGRVDLALAPEKRDDPLLEHRELFRDHLVLLCRSDHPLAAGAVTWRKLLPFGLIALKRTSSVRQLVEATYARLNTTLRPLFEVEQASTMAGFVVNRLGVGVLPFSLIRHLHIAPLVWRSIGGPQIHREISVVRLKSRTASPAAEAFVSTCIGHAARWKSGYRPQQAVRAARQA